MTSEPGCYCDANAGLPAEPDVLERFLEVERSCPGNPSSVHAPGRRSRAELEAARARIAAAMQVAPHDVVFTSGGTEAANLAVLGLGARHSPVLLAEVEHPAVHEPALARGIVPMGVDASGRAIVPAAPSEPIGLVALVHAQSELGTVQPVDDAIALAARLGVPCFVDAAQTLGRLPLASIVRAGAVISLSPHKCGGLRGHGVLLGLRLAERLQPLLRGGAQEHGLRAGTSSPSLAAANALAIERATNEQLSRAASMADARAAFLGGLRDSGVEHVVLTPDDSLPNTAMVRFPWVDGRSLLPTLDLAGLFASHGSACSSGSPTPPRILRALGLDESSARTCVRFSFGWKESRDELARAGLRAGRVVAARQKKK